MPRYLLAIQAAALTLALHGASALAVSAPQGDAAEQSYVIADQDAAGPAGSDMASLLVFLQSPRVKLLGITVVTGDGWRDEEVAHTLRLLEIVGRTDVKVYSGAQYPLLRTEQETALFEQVYGKVHWKGAWRAGNHLPEVVPSLPEGQPTTKPADEDGVHFMLRMVHQYPHKVTIYAAGPLTDIALAVRLDQHFAELAKELVIMGGSLNAKTEDPEFVNNPRHEFNFWFDPEAASITLRAPWARIEDTTVDASLNTALSEAMMAAYSRLNTPAAKYLTKFTERPLGSYLWDELAAAAWLEPGIIKRERVIYMDVNTTPGPGYGDTLIWGDSDKPAIVMPKIHAQVDVDADRLQSVLYQLFSKPAPGESFH